MATGTALDWCVALRKRAVPQPVGGEAGIASGDASQRVDSGAKQAASAGIGHPLLKASW